MIKKVVAIIFAGGSGQRMQSKTIPKQFLIINGKPIIIHTLQIFDDHPDIDAIVVSCKADWIDHLRQILTNFSIRKVVSIVPGGATGQASIRNGLLEAQKLFNDNSIVLIHDGVRPLIDSLTISNNISAVKTYGNAITITKASETIGITDDQEVLAEIVRRQNAIICRAPQSFILKDICEAHEKAIQDGITDVTDSATLYRHYKKELHLVEGPVDNIKITTHKDFYSLKTLLDLREYNQLLEKNDE